MLFQASYEGSVSTDPEEPTAATVAGLLDAGLLVRATEAVAPVLDLAPEQRINGIVNATQRVHRALRDSPLAEDASSLQEQIEAFTRTQLKSLPR
ncbi:hypothetical protein [Streptomyces sp. NBC_00057]|uniref:hypothetical protein n=1 Tax=Streptomyces sp. NBC_00057 TaxID=2975634 RepID=UPI002F915F80